MIHVPLTPEPVMVAVEAVPPEARFCPPFAATFEGSVEAVPVSEKHISDHSVVPLSVAAQAGLLEVLRYEAYT
jgi:hypothetical protein